MSTTLHDDHGRRTTFEGELVLAVSTDDPVKPQWTEIDIWRTEAGNFVVHRSVHYRVRHASRACAKARNADLDESDEHDTLPCNLCCPSGQLPRSGYSQASKVSVDAFLSVPLLIESFRHNGQMSQLARSILEDLSRLDSRVDAEWNTVVVP